MAFQHLRVVRPLLGAVAVHLGCSRPRLLGLDDDAGRAEGDAHQVRQLRVRIGIARHEEVVDHGISLS
jgi:hypothetical protein